MIIFIFIERSENNEKILKGEYHDISHERYDPKMKIMIVWRLSYSFDFGPSSRLVSDVNTGDGNGDDKTTSSLSSLVPSVVKIYALLAVF